MPPSSSPRSRPMNTLVAMSSVTLPNLGANSIERAGAEVWCRRILLLTSGIAAIALLVHFSVMVWAQNELSSPESVVAAQATMLAQDGTLYYHLNSYPYTVSAYMPIFYLLNAGLIKVGLPAALAGRLISFAAMLGIFWLVWRILILYTRERYYAWAGLVLCVSTSLVLSWGTVGQVDTLAVFFALLGFYQYARFAVRGENTLILAAVCVIAALFTKQTLIACPVAIVVALWFHNRKLALQFAAGAGGVVIALVLAINLALDGRFLEDTLFANLNPFAWHKLGQHVNYLLIAAGQLFLVAAVGFPAVMRRPARVLFLYLALALGVLSITAPKIGSDSNYQIESTVLLVLCACVALDAVSFFPLVLKRSKSWVTLLQIPLAIHFVVNVRIIEPFLIARIAKEQAFRQQVAAERTYLADGGRLLSADYNGAAHLRGRMEVETLIYTLLVRAGRIDPEPVRRDIAAKDFSTILLFQDVNRPFDTDLELLALTGAQLDEVRKHYRIVAHLPGPYLGGVYVYKPVPDTNQ